MRWPNDFVNKVICGDALSVLKTFPSESVDMAITSPPYWGLRDYGIEQIFGGDKEKGLIRGGRILQRFHKNKTRR